MDPPAQTEETLKDALHQSVASATTFDQVGEEPVFGNQSGIAILQEIRESREWRLRKDAEVAMLKDLNAKHDRAITMLTSRVTDLQRTSEGYLDIRDRFLDITRCDILQLPPPNQRSTAAVRRANEAAHGPDAVGDAYVYHLRSRADGRTCLKIHGMAFRDVLKLRKYISLAPELQRRLTIVVS